MHFQVLVSSCALGGLHFQAPNDPSCVPLSARGGIPTSQEGRPRSWLPLQDPAVLKVLGRDHSDGLQFLPGPAVCRQNLLSLSHHHWDGLFRLPQREGGCLWVEHPFSHSSRPGAGCEAERQSRAALQVGSAGVCSPEEE